MYRRSNGDARKGRTRFSSPLACCDERVGGRRVTSYREIGLSLDPFAIVFPKVAPRHKLSSQHEDDDGGQQELHQTPEPNLDFRSRVRLLRSNILPSGEPFVSLAFTSKPFLVFLLLLVPILFVPDHKKKYIGLPFREGMGPYKPETGTRGKRRREERTALTLGMVDSHCRSVRWRHDIPRIINRAFDHTSGIPGPRWRTWVVHSPLV